MSTEHKSTHIHINADMHASIYTCIYVYIIYVDESEGKILIFGCNIFNIYKIENH